MVHLDGLVFTGIRLQCMGSSEGFFSELLFFHYFEDLHLCSDLFIFLILLQLQQQSFWKLLFGSGYFVRTGSWLHGELHLHAWRSIGLAGDASQPKAVKFWRWDWVHLCGSPTRMGSACSWPASCLPCPAEILQEFFAGFWTPKCPLAMGNILTMSLDSSISFSLHC